MSPRVRDDLEIDACGILSRSVVPSIQKRKERFQAPLTHLRENFSNAIGSDVRDFGGSSHLPYDASIVARAGIEAAWRSTGRAD
jgi:hypothetical protein